MKQTILSMSRYGFIVLAMTTLAVLGVAMYSHGHRVARAAGQVATLPLTAAQPAAPSAQEPTAESMTGEYSGEVVLTGVLEGAATAALPTAPPTADGAASQPDLGAIDLALVLTQTGASITGYVNLEKTLVFNVAPPVNGTFYGTSFQLTSAPIVTVIDGQAIQRQFTLHGVIEQDNPALIKGEYRETLTGYTRKPMTVIGTFTLQRPVYEQAPVAAAGR